MKGLLKLVFKKMFKYMISISKNMYTDKINEKVNKYNNTYHWTIKMKPVDVNLSMHIDFNKENNKEGLVFKVGHHVRISKYKNIFAKGYVPNWSEDIYVILKVKNSIPWTYVISDFKSEKSVGMFPEKEVQNTNQKESRV